MIRKNQKYLNMIMFSMDNIILFISFLGAYYIKFYSGFFSSGGRLDITTYLAPLFFALPVYIYLNYRVGLYNPFRVKTMMTEIFKVIQSNLIMLFILIAALFIINFDNYSRQLLVMIFLLNTLGISLYRMMVRLILRELRSRGYNTKKCLVVGVGSTCDEFIDRIEKNTHWAYDIVGIVADMETADSEYKSKPIIGKINELEEILRNLNPDQIFITIPIEEYHMLGKIISVCEREGIRTQIVPDYNKYLPAKPETEDFDGLPVINIRHVPLDDVPARALKRLFDILFSIFVLTVFSPLYILCMIIIKLTSPGPVLYSQERIGKNNRTFRMYKFRSMIVQTAEEEKTGWSTKDDPRKTKWGSFMRKTSMDELPQFYNVLRGDMSVVGPRPERPQFVTIFKKDVPKYMVKHQVRPGITGWAQVNGWRGDTSISKRIEHDIYYVENWTFELDVQIIIMTLFKGILNKNAY